MNLTTEETSCLLKVLKLRHHEISRLLKQTDGDSSEKDDYKQTIKLLVSINEKVQDHQKSPESNAAAYGDRHVLVVDDNASIRQYMTLMLKNNGFRHFEEADDGHSAIAKIKSKDSPYDLVLCDMNMPTISGLDVLRLIRKEKHLAKMPFIMVTSETNKAKLLQAIKAGVNDYVAKPVDAEKLMKKIRKLLL